MKEDKDNCIFCRIVEKKAEATIIYEDDIALAFMDIQPVNEGHVLVIPKNHIPYLNSEHASIGAHLFNIGIKVKEAIFSSGIKCEGVNYLIADGEAAGQEVFHVHLHVFPRFKNDGFGFRFSEEYYLPKERAKLNKAASEIKKHLK